jgi:fumarate reductase subunit C
MSARYETWLWIAQRASAMVLAVTVLVHLITIVYAVQGGLTAAEILGRTRGNIAWYSFYVVFALAAAVHGSIGLRTIVQEMTAWRGRSLDLAALACAVLLAVTGTRAAGGLF